ncbi:MAG: ribosome small subunit-dependent GTPase A [Acidobacteria bacterium]|nr:MAG: ribosome small subunit-dependent GTPase A [Acidobacteriota bacterium]
MYGRVLFASQEQKMNLTSYGWTDFLGAQFNDYSSPGLKPARVVRSDRGEFQLIGADGIFRAQTAGILDSSGEPAPIATGDWVAVDRSQDTAVIRAILPRKSAMTRRRAGAAERAQVVAANVDFVLVVDGLDRGPNQRRIERGVALAYGGGATPIVILSKADLCKDREHTSMLVEEAAPFVETFFISATEGDGLEGLSAHLAPGSTSVLIGPSGVGKSTLANALSGEGHLAAGPVRAGDAKGRHTTTRSELILLPSGACMIDTPGVRELGLWLDTEAVDAAFADIEGLSETCRFGDCNHSGEPGCAVVEAVAVGELPASRLASYQKLLREAEIHEIRHDASKARLSKNRERNFAKICRAEQKRKNR